MTASEHPNVEPEGRRRFSLIHGGGGSAERSTSEDLPLEPDPDGLAEDRSGRGQRRQSGRYDPATGDPQVVEGEGDQGDRAEVDDPGAVEEDHGEADATGVGESDDELDDLEARLVIAEQSRAVLADTDPVSYFRSLRSLVRDNHSSVLGPLDYNEELSFHDPSQVVVPVAVTNADTTLLYARAAYPEFDEVILAAFTDPTRRDLLVAIYDMLFVEGRNIALVTNHGQIIDIALVVAALFLAMSDEAMEYGVLGQRITPEEIGDRCNTLVSRMVATRQAFGIPALQVTQHAMRVFLSLPQTASRRRAKIDPALVRANNALMRFELEGQLAKGGQLLAMAASGSQDLTIPQLMSKARAAWRSRRGDDPGEEPTLHLQPLYNGTMSLMRSCDYVLPVAVSLDSRCPAVVVGSMTRLTEDDDCHRVMDWIALAHQEATGIPTIYHQPGDDLLTQVRSLINR